MVCSVLRKSLQRRFFPLNLTKYLGTSYFRTLAKDSFWWKVVFKTPGSCYFWFIDHCKHFSLEQIVGAEKETAYSFLSNWSNSIAAQIIDNKVQLFLIAFNFHHFKCNWLHHLVNHLCYQKLHRRYLTRSKIRPWISDWCWVTIFFDSYSSCPANSFLSPTSMAKLCDKTLRNLFVFNYLLIFH